MSDHVQENGDSPELEALFDTLSHKQAAQAAAPAAPVMPPPVGVGDGSGDSAELEALFESVARTAALETPPVTVKPFGDNGDSDELQALFDSLAAAAPEPEVAPPPVPEMPKPDPQVLEMYTRVGQMTRKLHDALHELGYDKSLERAASTIPDAKDRLAYIASLTENAAMRALNATDQAGPHQDSIEKGATALSLGWDKLYAGQLSVDEFKLLSQHTRDYLASVPSHTQATRTQLMEIIMAQDFQDLTGQVIKKIVEMVQHMESELLAFLMEFSDKKMESKDNGLLNGPVVNAEGRTDVVTSQQQVDDLLESLGF